MGVAGAAYATILAQCTSAVICFAKVWTVKEEIGLSLMKWKPEAGYVQLVVKTGFPAAFQSCMIALGGMSVQRLVNSFGSSTMAAYVAANRVDSVGDSGHRFYRNGTFGIYRAEYCEESV